MTVLLNEVQQLRKTQKEQEAELKELKEQKLRKEEKSREGETAEDEYKDAEKLKFKPFVLKDKHVWPEAKEGQNWLTLKLYSWANMQKAGFDKALEQGLLTDLFDAKKWKKQNRKLGYELCQLITTSMAPHFKKVDRDDGFAVLHKLNDRVNAYSSERIAGLHERF